jgi:hypothetical protein
LTWEFPGALELPLPEPEEVQKTNGDAAGEGEWEDDDDDDEDDEGEDEESKAAVDRVLKKYEKAQVVDDDEGGGFDAWYDRSMKEKMDEWNGAITRYFCCVSFLPRLTIYTDQCWTCRANSRYLTTTRKIWVVLRSVMWRDCSG